VGLRARKIHSRNDGAGLGVGSSTVSARAEVERSRAARAKGASLIVDFMIHCKTTLTNRDARAHRTKMAFTQLAVAAVLLARLGAAVLRSAPTAHA